MECFLQCIAWCENAILTLISRIKCFQLLFFFQFISGISKFNVTDDYDASDPAMKYVKGLLGQEIEFYKFIKQRFYYISHIIKTPAI